MGKAKNKKAEFLKNHPLCCYCGGSEPATTIDHMPPSIFFDGKQRPHGFEFPACKRCNNGTGAEERVAAFIARLYPEPDTEKGRKEVERLMGAVHRTNPGLLKEMMPSRRDQRNFMKNRLGLKPGRDGSASKISIMKLNGPQVLHCLHTFGRKLTCAAHYYGTGQIIPPGGAIWLHFSSNVDHFEGNPLPDNLLKMMGDPLTLKQGSFSVGDQFAIRMTNSSDPRLSAYLAKFRFAFSLTGIVHCEPPDGFGPDTAEIFHPFNWTDSQGS